MRLIATALGRTHAIITFRNRSLVLIRNRSLAQHHSSLSCGGCAGGSSGLTGSGDGEVLHMDRKQLRNRSLVLVHSKLELELVHSSLELLRNRSLELRNVHEERLSERAAC